MILPTVGIIAEYNPFHNGHIHQIEQIKSLLPEVRCIAVMSGNFTQRGEAAIIDKWQRAESAVRNGIDLVLELPLVFAVRSAQDFARGGVALFIRLGIVDALAFGAETPDLPLLQRIATSADEPAVQSAVHKSIAEGLPYSAAMEKAISQRLVLDAGFLRGPNNILAVEYMRALRRFASGIKPLPLPREYAAHSEKAISGVKLANEKFITSAAAIRYELTKKQPDFSLLARTLPMASLTALRQQATDWPTLENMWRALLAKLLWENGKTIKDCYGINEGLENRLREAAKSSLTLAEFIENACSKRYPRSRIGRLTVYLLLGLKKGQIMSFDEAGPSYARVLAFNGRGRELLRDMKKKAAIPIVTKMAQGCRALKCSSIGAAMMAYDISGTELFNLCYNNLGNWQQDFINSPIYCRSDESSTIY